MFYKQSKALLEKKKDVEQQLGKCKEEIYHFVESVDTNWLKEQSYSDIKELVNELKKEASYGKTKELNSALEEAKMNEYPALRNAHYFPILNQLTTLTKEEIRIVDKELRNRSKSRGVYQNWMELSNLGINNDKNEALYRELVDLGVVKMELVARCPECTDNYGHGMTLTKEQLDMLCNDKDSKESRELLYKFSFQSCFACMEDFDLVDDDDVCDKFIELLQSPHSRQYKMNIEPDLTYDKI